MHVLARFYLFFICAIADCYRTRAHSVHDLYADDVHAECILFRFFVRIFKTNSIREKERERREGGKEGGREKQRERGTENLADISWNRYAIACKSASRTCTYARTNIIYFTVAHRTSFSRTVTVHVNRLMKLFAYDDVSTHHIYHIEKELRPSWQKWDPKRDLYSARKSCAFNSAFLAIQIRLTLFFLSPSAYFLFLYRVFPLPIFLYIIKDKIVRDVAFPLLSPPCRTIEIARRPRRPTVVVFRRGRG